MVFLAGPRQVGKTHLAKSLLLKDDLYLNWDSSADRRRILSAQWPLSPALIVLDELHKYRFWKRFIKGEFDTKGDRYHFLVTGSARLDIYRRGGDSLQGRYHHVRLHPFSFGELNGLLIKQVPFQALRFAPSWDPSCLKDLIAFGGFPEPLIGGDPDALRLWQKERVDRVIREDIRDLERVPDTSMIQVLADILPNRVAAPLSVNSLREDLEVSHKAVSHWLDILERLYVIFRIRPFHHSRLRTLRKEPKVYLWDYSLVEEAGAKLENLIASHLLKLCHYMEDTQGYRIELCYMRDVEKREVDFVVLVNRKPWFAVEVKKSDSEPWRPLRYFGERFKIPFRYQVVFEPQGEFENDGIQVISAERFLSALP